MKSTSTNRSRGLTVEFTDEQASKARSRSSKKSKEGLHNKLGKVNARRLQLSESIGAAVARTEPRDPLFDSQSLATMRSRRE